MTDRPDNEIPVENVFTQLLRKGLDEHRIPERTQRSREWYRDQAKRVVVRDDKALMSSDPTRFRQMVVPGRLYMFFYDPKHKKTLPYYDTFPMIFPIDVDNNSFLGLNIHYLPLNFRAKLLDALYNLKNNNRFDETTKIALSYKLLKSVSDLRYFKPTIKRYLKIHVRSRFVSIGADEWSIATFLPLQRFQKQPTTKVWADSVQMIQGNTKPAKTNVPKSYTRKNS